MCLKSRAALDQQQPPGWSTQVGAPPVHCSTGVTGGRRGGAPPMHSWPHEVRSGGTAAKLGILRREPRAALLTAARPPARLLLAHSLLRRCQVVCWVICHRRWRHAASRGGARARPLLGWHMGHTCGAPDQIVGGSDFPPTPLAMIPCNCGTPREDRCTLEFRRGRGGHMQDAKN